MIALLAGCSVLSFQNDPPKLDAVNGVLYPGLLAGGFGIDPAFIALPETEFEVTVEFHDGERDGVQVWWPRAPAGWEFDADGTNGVWHVPADPLPVWGMVLLLEDDHKNDPQTSEFFVPIAVLGADTALYGY